MDLGKLGHQGDDIRVQADGNEHVDGREILGQECPRFLDELVGRLFNFLVGDDVPRVAAEWQPAVVAAVPAGRAEVDIVDQVAGQPVRKDIRVQDTEFRRTCTLSRGKTIDGPSGQELRAYREVVAGPAGAWFERQRPRWRG